MLAESEITTLGETWIETEADFILYSAEDGVLSEHCTVSEATMAYFEEAGRREVGERLPIIYKRAQGSWVPL